MNCCTLTEAVNRLMLPDNIELPPELDYDLYLSVVLSALEAWPGQDKVKFAAMGASFFCFQYFHRHSDAESILKGDYFFAQFLKFAIELDIKPLTEKFSRLLCQTPPGTMINCDFIRDCAALVSQEVL